MPSHKVVQYYDVLFQGKQETDKISTSSTSSTAKFMFSTENFTKCFNSPAGDFLNRKIYTTTNHKSGDFHYSGRLSRKQQLKRCDIEIRVPEDNNIQFNLTDINLPCQFGQFIIYASTNKKSGNRRLLYCDENLDDRPRSTVTVLSHRAVLTFIIKIFSLDIILDVHFAAFPRSVKLSSHHSHASDNVTDQLYRNVKPSQAMASVESCYSTAGSGDMVSQLRPDTTVFFVFQLKLLFHTNRNIITSASHNSFI